MLVRARRRVPMAGGGEREERFEACRSVARARAGVFMVSPKGRLAVQGQARACCSTISEGEMIILPVRVWTQKGRAEGLVHMLRYSLTMRKSGREWKGFGAGRIETRREVACRDCRHVLDSVHLAFSPSWEEA